MIVCNVFFSSSFVVLYSPRRVFVKMRSISQSVSNEEREDGSLASILPPTNPSRSRQERDARSLGERKEVEKERKSCYRPRGC